jgi:formylglycine-generating enzyme required for sulfatase activity
MVRVGMTALTVATLSPLLAAARPRRRLEAPPPAPPAPPALTAGTEAGVAVLRAPGGAEVLIRGGTFTMGSSDAEFAVALGLCRTEPRREDCKEEWFANEQSPHEVYLDDYWIDRTEVTVARYRQCVSAGQCALPPYADGGERYDQPDLPVSLVTWNDARRFCAWAGGRLPTEAEWERAARGLSGRRYPWGNVYNPFLSNHGAWALEDHDGRDGFLELAPVGSFPDGRTPEGVDDLAGNVEEWVADWFAPEYPKASAANPRGPDAGDRRVVRGGGYVRGRPWLRGAARNAEPAAERAPWIGFRCAREARARP